MPLIGKSKSKGSSGHHTPTHSAPIPSAELIDVLALKGTFLEISMLLLASEGKYSLPNLPLTFPSAPFLVLVLCVSYHGPNMSDAFAYRNGMVLLIFARHKWRFRAATAPSDLVPRLASSDAFSCLFVAFSGPGLDPFSVLLST